jgi:hypothetical protein
VLVVLNETDRSKNASSDKRSKFLLLAADAAIAGDVYLAKEAFDSSFKQRQNPFESTGLCHIRPNLSTVLLFLPLLNFKLKQFKEFLS